jgi:Flp pilus assembly protein TadG
MFASSRRRGEDGAEAVEFALIAVPFMLLLLGIIQYGFYFWTAETTNSAARETARRVIVGDCWTQAQADTFARHNAPQTTSVAVSPLPTSSTQVGDTIRVTVTANAHIFGLSPLPNGGAITRDYVARMESVTSSGTCPL